MFGPELYALGDRPTVHHVLSREDGGALRGRVTPEIVDQLVSHPIDVWFLCEPQDLVDAMDAH